MSKKKSLSRLSVGVKKNTPTAYFDELCQISSLLSCGLEQEWIEFISNQADLQQRCQAAEGEVTRLRLQFNQLKSDKEASDMRLKHVRNQLAEEKSQRQTLSKQNEKLKQQISVIREILEDKDRLSMMTDEERHTLLNRSMLKKQIDKVFEDTTMDLDSDQSLEPSFEALEKSKGWRRKSRRSHVRKSEGQVLGVAKKKRTSAFCVSPTHGNDEMMEPTASESSDPPILYPNLKVFKKEHPHKELVHPEVVSMKSEATTISTTETYDSEYVPSDTESIASNTSESSVPNRSHHFCVSKVLIKPEQCKACRKRIGFSNNAVRCKYCKIIVHQDCKHSAPLPCVPLLRLPSNKQDGTLSSYVPKNPPHIPSILIRCVQEIEARGLNEAGLYRTSGSAKVVKELLEKMLRPRGCPNLRKLDDTSVLTGVVKTFLFNLNDPLLTNALSEEFKDAVEKDNTNHLYSTIAKLPHENRHTLAFLVIHLQKVAESEMCKMPRSNLARVLSPNLVALPPITDMGMAMREQKRAMKVIDQLLSLPPSYWINMLNPVEEFMSPYSSDVERPGTPGTPEMLKVQPGMYQPPTPGGTPCKETTFTQRMFGTKKKAFFSNPYIHETP